MNERERPWCRRVPGLRHVDSCEERWRQKVSDERTEEDDEDTYGYSRSDLLFGGNW